MYAWKEKIEWFIKENKSEIKVKWNKNKETKLLSTATLPIHPVSVQCDQFHLQPIRMEEMQFLWIFF